MTTPRRNDTLLVASVSDMYYPSIPGESLCSHLSVLAGRAFCRSHDGDHGTPPSSLHAPFPTRRFCVDTPPPSLLYHSAPSFTSLAMQSEFTPSIPRTSAAYANITAAAFGQCVEPGGAVVAATPTGTGCVCRCRKGGRGGGEGVVLMSVLPHGPRQRWWSGRWGHV
jgi:hypothetical protein